MELRDWLGVAFGCAGLAVGGLSIFFALRRERRDRIIRLIERKNSLLSQLRILIAALETMKSHFAQSANMLAEGWGGEAAQVLAACRAAFDTTMKTQKELSSLLDDITAIQWHRQGRHKGLVVIEEILAQTKERVETYETVFRQSAQVCEVIRVEYEKRSKE